MSEITKYSELERFWISLEEDFFRRVEDVLKKSGMDLEKEQDNIDLLKEKISKSMIHRFNGLCDELNWRSLSHKYVRAKFNNLEKVLKERVNSFIVNWLNEGAW